VLKGGHFQYYPFLRFLFILSEEILSDADSHLSHPSFPSMEISAREGFLDFEKKTIALNESEPFMEKFRAFVSKREEEPISN
jgi:hypothetical protein